MKIKTRAKLIEINAAGAQDVPSRVLLLPAGNLTTFDGVRYLVDDLAMQSILAAFAERQIDLVIDYEHQTHLSEGEAPAAGWVKDLEAGREGIWGRVDWTDKAQNYLAEREYRYLSPAILVNKETRRVQEITDLGLTNAPRINAYPPVVNKGGAEGDDMEFLNKLIKLLGLEAGADEGKALQAVESIINSAKELRAKVWKMAGAEESADDAAALAKLETALNKATVEPASLNSIAKALNLEQGATESAVLGAIKGLQEGSGKYADLAQQLNDMKADQAKEKAKTAVEAALNSGKIAPTQKEWALGYAEKDPAGFAAYINNAPQAVPLKDLPGGSAPKATGPTDETQLEINKQLGISPDLFAKHNQPEKEA